MANFVLNFCWYFLVPVNHVKSFSCITCLRYFLITWFTLNVSHWQTIISRTCNTKEQADFHMHTRAKRMNGNSSSQAHMKSRMCALHVIWIHVLLLKTRVRQTHVKCICRESRSSCSTFFPFPCEFAWFCMPSNSACILFCLHNFHAINFDCNFVQGNMHLQIEGSFLLLPASPHLSLSLSFLVIAWSMCSTSG
jgi:hypothetical protein